MAQSKSVADVAKGRLTPGELKANFTDLHPPLSDHEALVEARRCYFCFDAPCMIACPTAIDIPLFIREIAAGNPKGAARTILDQNILGGMCARVCPTETLCEEVCVRETAEGKPVKIGELQRYATDVLLQSGDKIYERPKATGKRVAVVGSGPAGLACAHRLAVHGHAVTILEARDKAGGLNEYGIAAYKVVDQFAAREIGFVFSIGGIKLKTGVTLGRDVTLEDLASDYDAVFLGLGLAGVNALGAAGEEAEGVADAVSYISGLRQAKDLGKLPVGRRVVVIGGGMTAIDIAVQSKLLGAEDVTILYRRGKAQMNASTYEQDLAQTKGVKIKHWVRPRRIVAQKGHVAAVECEYTAEKAGKLAGTGETFSLPADMVFKAIGQTFDPAPVGKAIKLDGGRIKVDAEGRTSVKGIWAGGDCTAGGEDLTVTAVADGREAAESMHRALSRA
ncbi:MAG: NAD(P)-dependent oxidoreductase [Hyphomicrobiaceae bacterium]